MGAVATMVPGTTRRTMMRLLAGAAVCGLDIVTMCATSTNVAATKPSGTTLEPRAVEDYLVQLLADPNGSRAIGRAYLTGDARPLPTLMTLRMQVIRALRLDNADLSRSDLAKLSVRLRRRITQDFVDGDVAIVDGWMLSLVEAQICAIAYLSAIGDV